jgi:hypothetical protein
VLEVSSLPLSTSNSSSSTSLLKVDPGRGLLALNLCLVVSVVVVVAVVVVVGGGVVVVVVVIWTVVVVAVVCAEVVFLVVVVVVGVVVVVVGTGGGGGKVTGAKVKATGLEVVGSGCGVLTTGTRTGCLCLPRLGTFLTCSGTVKVGWAVTGTGLAVAATGWRGLA